MKRRTFALLTAVITFTAGVVFGRLWTTNLFKTPPAAVTIEIIKEAQSGNYRLTGPYQFGNLKIFLIHGPDAPDGLVYTSLQEAMLRKIVTVHETSTVNELSIENVSPFEGVFVQAGDIVKGGKQDRVLAVDLILPPNSGIVPISAFCVEQSRWQARGVESADQFTLTEMVATPSLLQAVKDAATQAGVWKEVESAQYRVGAGVASDIRSEQSKSSLPLALESDAVQNSAAPYTGNLYPVPQRFDDVIGFAFAIDDEIRSADVYSSNMMFKRFWHRLLKAAAVEAVAAPRMQKARDVLTIETVGSFLSDADLGEQTVETVNERTQSVKRITQHVLFFESRDIANGYVWVHRNYLSRIAD
jgi:hypothetical protein